MSISSIVHSSSLKRGFTLIELLVVIAIIGILSSVVLVSLNTARAKGNDTKRLADLQELRKAVEIYYTEKGTYPSTTNAWWGVCSSFGSHPSTGATGWVPNLAPAYIPVLPSDPKTADTSRCYLYRSDGKDYMLMAYGTVESYTGTANKWTRPSHPTENDFVFYTSGASTW